ncbi:MAG: chemotaxis protein CheB [Bacillota bacterium]|nr:chemotaxis protein CheB [Bacillota bacterium]
MTEKGHQGLKEKLKFKKSVVKRDILRTQFPIIGIGASAGGLDALEVFLRNVPEKTDMAFIIVQHMDPTRKGMLVELLQRATTMDVYEVEERTAVKQGCVYVIPPNRDMSILHGVLHLFEHHRPRGLRMPIDFFFRSLADDQRENSVGVVLSGMGTDGTLGLRAIKEKGGVVFVQEPASAKFDGMPTSAVDAGLADVVAPVEMLPAKVAAYIKQKPHIDTPGSELSENVHSAFDKIVILLRSQTGHDFSSYKKTTVYRRIERRMGVHQIEKISVYIRFLQENPQELELLFKELLIGVTGFFRDPEEWERLRIQVIPELLGKRVPSQALRAWIPACSTGEEAYSLAIVFKEALSQMKPAQNHKLQIFATDLDNDAIDKAREAIYPANIAADVPPEYIQKYFNEVDQGYQVKKSVREMVIFAQQNIIMDPPFTKIDILCCRNLLIYLTQEMQKKLLPLFHYSLNTDGFLFLGNAESVGNFTENLEPLETKSRLYRRRELSPLPLESEGFPSSFVPARRVVLYPTKPVHNYQLLVDQLVLQHFSPPTVLVNEKGDILYITGRTGKYLEPAAGKANWNIFAMARTGLRYELSETFRKALLQQETITFRNAVLKNNDSPQSVDITVQPLKEPEVLRGLVLIVFSDVPTPPVTKTPGRNKPVSAQRVEELERELEQTRQELLVTRTEMQASQEDIKSYSEELQSTNEELQSTNEELTTSKEELQSLNEELQTVNHELQAKVDELSLANNDMQNLFNSTKIPTLFLDSTLSIRRFTNQMSQISKLIPSDVGRPITDIASDLIYPQMAEDVKEVLQTLTRVEKQVTTTDGCWFHVRILPYRTLEDKIDGVVVTFVDISNSKALEAALREAQAALEERVAMQDSELLRVEGMLQDEIKRGHREVGAGKALQKDKKSKE